MKNDLTSDINILQKLLYKGLEKFERQVISSIANHKNESVLISKAKLAIENKLPTVALRLYRISRFYKIQTVEDPELLETFRHFNSKDDAVFLRNAFGEGDDVDIPTLGEFYYYLCKTKVDEYDRRDMVLRRLTDQKNTKYSDFLNLGMVLTSPEYYDEDLKEQIDTFSGVVIYKYLIKYVQEIKSSGVYPENLKAEFKERYKYFAEGIKKWAFLDNEIKDKALVEDVRSLALKNNYKAIPIKGKRAMLSKLSELYEYHDECYLRFCNNSYVFKG
ncbi:MAG TPA: hypothetical protein PKA90_16090 [Ignavibacteria bacterium]|nr:hypothetical protein [Ignavibacteria bacterium]